MLYDYWSWWRMERGQLGTLTIGDVTRVREHPCLPPDLPRWVKTDNRCGPFGLFRETVLSNPFALEAGDIWTCPECGAKWMLSGGIKGGGDY